MILLFEPVVAGFVGYLVASGSASSGYVGALVILAGIVIAESRSWRPATVGPDYLTERSSGR